MKEFKPYDPAAKPEENQNIADNELGAVAGGAVYPDKYHIQCPVCFKLIEKTPAAFDKHNWESGCRYKL